MMPGAWTCLTSCGTPCTVGPGGSRGGDAEEYGGAAGRTAGAAAGLRERGRGWHRIGQAQKRHRQTQGPHFHLPHEPRRPAHEQRQRERLAAGQDQTQGQRMLPHGIRRGELRHRRLRHTDGGQERAEPLRGPQGHFGPCAGIASLLQSLLTDRGAGPPVYGRGI